MKWRDWDINLKVRLIGEGLFNVLFWMYFPFMAIYFSEHFGQEMAGMLLVLSQVLGVVIGLFGGYCADHFGRKRMMVFSAIGQTVCFAFFAFANSPWLVSPWLTFISFSWLGLFGQLYWPASSAMIADVVPEQHRASVFAVFYTSINVTVVIGPLLGAIFFFNERFLFLVICTAVSAGLIWALQHWIHETAPQAVRETHQEEKPNWMNHLIDQLSDYRVIFTDHIFLLYILAGVLVAQTFMQLDMLIAVYTTNKVPLQTLLSFGNWQVEITGRNLFSVMVSMNGLCVALLTVIVTKWMTKFREGNVFMGSSFCYGIAMILMGSTRNIWLLLFGIVLFSWAELMTVGVQDSFIAKLAPKHLRAQYFAASGLRFSLGRTIAPIAIPMTVWFGYSWTFVILGTIAFLGMISYGVMFSMYDRRKLTVSGQSNSL
ncbi:MDR family MFS transporter [Sporolactobacillus nakayamae]|uniref:Predicted arabinose efflux permease, MFS family n=1 Tax=Sporolactobacillus nakayamae TaxID=269670 RepID=A0A1I2QTN2_9BACL|nr:MFS transporter [Sporolactobacillus nakayamae]SFG31704.1 Predicted arabinose efflux permease, MFS family [Sporolactobacillus nakayamae]